MVVPVVLVARLLANVGRRVARVEKLGLANSATVEFHQVRELAKNKLLSNSETLKALKRLDKSAGTFVKSADRFVQTEVKRQARQARKQFVSSVSDKLVSRSFDSLSKSDLTDFVKLTRGQLQARVRNLRKLGLDSTNAVTQFEKLTSEIRERGLNNLDIRSLRRIAREMNRAREWDGLSVKGARSQLSREVEVFGDQAIGWTREEKGAVWDAMRKEFELNMQSFSSDTVLGVMSEAINGGMKVEFFQGRNGLEAVFARDFQELGTKVAVAKVNNSLIDDMLRSSNTSGTIY